MKKGLLIAFIIFLGGCSTKFTYNNLDWLIHWYIDDYVSLSSHQEDIFDEHFEGWQDWHRSEELAKYVTQLKALNVDLQAESLTASQIENHLNESRMHWERLRDHVSPELADMASELTDEQVDSLFEALTDENDDIKESIEEFQAKSKTEQAEARIEEIEEGVKDYIGRLNSEQKAIIKTFAPEFNSTRSLWLTYRTEFQQAARLMIDKRHDNPEFVEEFIALMTHPDKFRSEAYIALRVENTRVYSRMAEQLFYTLDEKQKSKLISKIDDMIDDFEYLMRND